jgi:hypothetical protein
MFNRTKISAISGIVGWLQPANPTYAILDATNLASTSGRYVNENKFVKIEYLKDTQDYIEITDEQFNSELVQLQKTAILSVMDQVFSEPDYIDRQVLYKYPNNKTETDALPEGFVGYRICQGDTKNLAFEIKRDLLEFDGTGDITLVLFNSQKKEAVFTETVTITSTLQEVELNWKIDNSTPLYKGEYYYGYFTDGVTVTPFKRDYQNASVQSIITDLDIENIKVPTATGTDIFDLDDIEGAEEVWGLNPDITVFYDYTDLILQNQILFGRAIQLHCQIQAMTYYLSSLRTNKNDRKVSEMMDKLIVEIDGRVSDTGSFKVGLSDMLIREIGRVQKEIKRLKEGYEHDGLLTITRTM